MVSFPFSALYGTGRDKNHSSAVCGGIHFPGNPPLEITDASPRVPSSVW